MTQFSSVSSNKNAIEVVVLVARDGIEPPTRGFSVRSASKEYVLEATEAKHAAVSFLIRVFRKMTFRFYRSHRLCTHDDL